MTATIPETYTDDDGRLIINMRVTDRGIWSMLTGRAVHVPRDFPWWALWCWPGLWLERRRCRRMAEHGPHPMASIMGQCNDDGRITHCVFNGMTLMGPGER